MTDTPEPDPTYDHLDLTVRVVLSRPITQAETVQVAESLQGILRGATMVKRIAGEGGQRASINTAELVSWAVTPPPPPEPTP